MQTIICMKWGTRYGADFVNRLYSTIQRQTKRPTKLVCFTDDPSSIDPSVQVEPLPSINLPEQLRSPPWRKLAVWKAPLANLKGDILFLDLDLVITGNLDAFFDYEPGRFIGIENWTQMGQNIANTSVFRFPVGKYTHIFDRFDAEPQRWIDQYVIEQVYISREIEDMAFWPAQWCVSFKHSLLPAWPVRFWKTPALPEETKVVAFTGKPDQDEAIRGEWPAKWYKKFYKYVKPTPWIAEHWQ